MVAADFARVQQPTARRLDREDSEGSAGLGRDRRWLALAVLVVSVSVVVLDTRC
jgi:hypothetical protein